MLVEKVVREVRKEREEAEHDKDAKRKTRIHPFILCSALPN